MSMLGADVCDEALGRKLHSLGRMQREAPSQLGIGGFWRSLQQEVADQFDRLHKR